MPWKYTTPQTVETIFDAADVVSYHLDQIDSPAGPRFTIEYVRGSYDQPTDTFTALEEVQTVTLDGQGPGPDVIDVINAVTPLEGEAMYDTLRRALLNVLADEGLIPAGSTS